VSVKRSTVPASSEHEDGASDTAILTIDLAALAANYRRLRDLASPAECAAVVKADAYGLRMAMAAPALARAGCKTFFVATLDEARALRALLLDPAIYVFAGLMPGTAEIYRAYALRPVLNSAEEIAEWASFCTARGEKLACAVHIDSGMNRLGLSAEEVDRVAEARELWHAITLSLVMSHLACADEPQHPKSETQRKSFDRARAKLPTALASLANSAGILLGRAYAYDLVRPGIALYGGKPARGGDNPFQPVVYLTGRILQVRKVDAGETVGYGATHTLKRASRVAVVSVGYADGFFRSLSHKE
jgi:alanine racemase